MGSTFELAAETWRKQQSSVEYMDKHKDMATKTGDLRRPARLTSRWQIIAGATGLAGVFPIAGGASAQAVTGEKADLSRSNCSPVSEKRLLIITPASPGA
jgi:hypothetical protein